MGKTLSFIFFFCTVASMLLSSSSQLVAQVYPVQANVSIQPPYSPYLTDYTIPGTQKFLLQLRTNDITITDHSIRFRITIEGLGITIRTKQNFIPQQHILYGGGTPTILYGEDLQEYFHPNNLEFAGLSKAEFLKTGKLPEGVYKFSVEVFSYNRNVQLSNKTFTMAWIILNDPPMLNLPRKDAKIKILDPTSIAFTWTPRHTASPNSAFSSEYIFRLVEIWPENRNPYDAFLSLPALYEETTSQTQIVYGLEHPALIPGRKYAWQVQAVDVDGKDLFKNQGRSEVYVFQFGDALSAPENIQQDGANATTVNLSWDAPIQGAMPKQYRVRYRKKGSGDNTAWYEAITDQRWIALTSLQVNTSYEIQLRSEAQTQLSEYSQIQVIQTEAETTLPYTCGKESAVSGSENSSPLLMLVAGDVISASNFKVVVTEAEGKTGTFSGKGVMAVPFFNMANVKVSFSGIQVNDKYELMVGEILTTYNPGSPLARQVEEAHKIGEENPDTPSGSEQSDSTEALSATYIIAGTIDSVYVNADGKIEVLDEQGNVTAYEPKKDEKTGEAINTIIVDSAGDRYTVTAEGKVTKETGGASSSLASANAKKSAVNFKPAIDQLYGFDQLMHDAHADTYEKESMNGAEFLVSWKSVASGSTDKVIAWSEEMKNLYDDVNYQSLNGDIPKRQSESTVELVITGTGHEEVSEIEAYVKDPSDDSKKVVVGRVNVISYDPVVRNLVLIPVNDASIPSQVSLAQELNKIFSPAIVTWQIRTEKNIEADLGSDGKLDDGSSGLLSNYTQEMRDVIHAYKEDNDIEEDTYYLFFAAGGETGSKDGYMPRKKQCGFIFTGNVSQSNMSKIVAHELAHGAFRLEHTFETYPSLSKGTTDNLMDYNTGTRLDKYQWDLIHNPVAVWGLFEADEEGALTAWSGTLVDEQHTELFDHIYDNNHIGELKYLTDIERLLVEDPSKQTFDLNYDNDDDHKEWVNSWKIRVVNSETVLNNTIKVIQDAKKGEKLGKVYLRPKHIYIAKYKYNDRDYPIAIYNAGTAEVMDKVFTKVEITDTDQLDADENKKRVYIEETFSRYFIVAFYEDGKSTPTLMIQVEKFPFSDLMHNSMEEWLKFLKILIEETEKEEVTEEIFLDEIEYVSQFDETIFGQCTGCWGKTCCRRATEYMMGNTNIANCSDSTIAASAPYMTVLGSIITSSFSDNSSQYTKDTYNTASLNYNSTKAKEAVDYMMDRLRNNKPVLIGVHYTNGGKPPNNNNRATRHFMVVVGMTVKGESVSFRFYDPGRSLANESHATSVNNLLKYDADQGYVRGLYNGETYTLSEVVKTQ